MNVTVDETGKKNELHEANRESSLLLFLFCFDDCVVLGENSRPCQIEIVDIKPSQKSQSDEQLGQLEQIIIFIE